MKPFRLLLTAGSLSLLTFGVGGCLKAPDYSTTPEISFNNIYHAGFNNAGGQGDTVAVTINFQDGDGDLGLSDTDIKDVTTYPSPFNNNWFVEPYVKNASGQFVKLADLNRSAAPGSTVIIKAGDYDSRFPHVSTTADGHALPLKGTLTWGFSFFRNSPFKPGEEVRFEVTIADRAKHLSNTITTASVVLAK